MRTIAWQNIEPLLKKGEIEEAIRRVKDDLVASEDPLQASFLARDLADLYKTYLKKEAEPKAVQYMVLAVEGFIREGQFFEAIAGYHWLKEIPSAFDKLSSLKTLLSDSFSLKRVKRNDLDKDHAPPTPFQEITASVVFEKEKTEETRRTQLEFTLPSTIEFFSTLRADELSSLVDSTFVRRMPAGQILFREGDPAHSFFLVLRGELSQMFKGELQEAQKAGDFIGELSFFSGLKRTSVVKTKTEVELLEFSGKKFVEFAKSKPLVQQKVIDFFERRLFLNVAHRSRLFKGLSLAQISYCFDSFQACDKPEDFAVQRAKTPVTTLRFVVQGELMTDDMRFGPGQFVWEKEFFKALPSTQLLKTKRHSAWVEISYAQFEKLCQLLPQLDKNSKADGTLTESSIVD